MQRILIVEDEDEIRMGLTFFFEASGYCCTEAVNGYDALKVIEKESPDLIISDIMMPVLDGYEFLKIIKSREATRSIPFIILSAKTETEEIEKGYTLGISGFLAKPFSLSELNKLVERYLIKYT
ncbi:MAG: response regulator [Bacteroidota bacterium]|nr:response regulator [Bacteroidota bacterium]MDP4191561.1 response regulator [Bacteroidota bacterium]MDP4195686.1 response regulator [Bacteroidota bacterium]